MEKIKKINRKSMLIRESGRSTDFISPSFGFGCLYDCSYCYMKRHKPEGLDIATNIGDILTAINNHSYFAMVDKPNQTHENYITYDISCNEDFSLHAKYYNWKYIFDFFKDHPIAMASFATKYVNPVFLEYDPLKKVRIRYSLMPQKYADLLEPNTSSIEKRISAIDTFINAGYEVHINFSPVIITDGWLSEYKILFEQVNDLIQNKNNVKAEVIFLTHNKEKHLYNVTTNKKGEELLWVPEMQENKISQYGGNNIRYKYDLKLKHIKHWIEVHNKVIPWNIIRYIF